MGQDLKTRSTVKLGAVNVCLAPYADDVYCLELDGEVIATFATAKPPYESAMKALKAANRFSASQLEFANRWNNWTKETVDTYLIGG